MVRRHRRPSYKSRSAPRRASPEEALQRWCVQLLNDVAVPAGWWYTHIPNQRADAVQAKILKGLGVTPGVADLLLRAPLEHPLAAVPIWVEIKAPKGTWPATQRHFCHGMGARGDRYHLLRSQDEFVDLLRGLGVPVSL